MSNTVPTAPDAAEPQTGDYTRLIASRILAALQHSNLSLVDLAAAAGMDPHDLAASLGGRRGLWFDEVVLLGRALGLGFELFESGRR